MTLTSDQQVSTLDASAAQRSDDNKRKASEGRAAIRRLSEPIKAMLLMARVLTVISAVLSVAPYVALVRLGELLLSANAAGAPVDAAAVRAALGWLVATYLARVASYFGALLITHVADLRLRTHLRRAMVARLARAPLGWFTESNSGLVRKAVQDDATTVHTVIAHSPVDVTNAVVTPLALVSFVFTLDWRLGLLSVITIPGYLVSYGISMRGMDVKTAEMDGKLAKISATMLEFVAGISVIKAFGRVGEAHQNYLQAADEFAEFYDDWCKPLLKISALSQLWISAPALLLVNLGGGALMIRAGWVSLPEVLASALVALVVPATVMVVATIAWSYQLAGGAAIRISKLLDTEQLDEPATAQKASGTLVEFDDVSFAYGQTQALSHVSLKLEPGSVTALLGPSGSGKSTLATLIARFNDPQSGAVRIGGVDVRDLGADQLYSLVSFVLQDAQLLQSSVRANIALGRPDATLDQVRAAARVAQIDDFIMGLANGYDTILGDETSLSGGQAQRVAIARAVLVDAPIILLDEATAFADPDSEADIQQALSALVRGRTVLVIAHRPWAIRGADQIVLLDRGRIIARGSHEELCDNPAYRQVWEHSGLTVEDGTPTTDQGAGRE